MSFQVSGSFGSGTTQSLKSALDSRVIVGQTEKLASQRNNLGEALMCVAGAGDIANDIYGRPVSQNTLLLNDSSCSNYTEWSAARRIGVENNERPYLAICAAGLRRASDWMGVGRDLQQQNLYGTGYQGNMIRHYPTSNNAPWAAGPQGPNPPYAQKAVQPFSFSHDGSSHLWRG